VQPGATADTRVLTVNDPNFGPTVTLTEVRYELDDPAAARYSDRATNQLLDFRGTNGITQT